MPNPKEKAPEKKVNIHDDSSGLIPAEKAPPDSKYIDDSFRSAGDSKPKPDPRVDDSFIPV